MGVEHQSLPSAIESPYSVASGLPGDSWVDCLSSADCHPTTALRRLGLLASNQLEIANAANASLPPLRALCCREFRPTPRGYSQEDAIRLDADCRRSVICGEMVQSNVQYSISVEASYITKFGDGIHDRPKIQCLLVKFAYKMLVGLTLPTPWGM
jgi:hypothetical protein